MPLSKSLFMLLKETVEESEAFIAQRLLKRFVQEVSILYGAAAQTILLLCQEIICQQYFLPFMYSIEHPPAHVGQCLLHESSMASPCVLVNRGGTFVVAKMPNLFEGD